jgi:hypothetical protein
MIGWDTIKDCTDGDEESCKEIGKEGAKQALVSAGVDERTADAAIECADSRDSEVCAKASATAAAVYGCTAATEGAGYEVCQKVAPIVVDQAWPFIGPPLTSSFDVAIGALGAVASLLGGVVGAAAELLGFGSDDRPTRTELVNQMVWNASSIVDTQYDNAVAAAMYADLESRKYLGLKIPSSLHHIDTEMGDIARSRVSQAVVPKLEAVAVAGKGRNLQNMWGAINLHVVDPSYQPAADEVMLLASAPPAGWQIGEDGYSPVGYKLINHETGSNYWTIRDLADAYSTAIAQRVDALRAGATEAVGQTVAENVNESEVPSSSGSTIVTLLALAALSVGGYYLWKKS